MSNDDAPRSAAYKAGCVFGEMLGHLIACVAVEIADGLRKLQDHAKKIAKPRMTNNDNSMNQLSLALPVGGIAFQAGDNFVVGLRKLFELSVEKVKELSLRK